MLRPYLCGHLFLPLVLARLASIFGFHRLFLPRFGLDFLTASEQVFIASARRTFSAGRLHFHHCYSPSIRRGILATGLSEASLFSWLFLIRRALKSSPTQQRCTALAANRIGACASRPRRRLNPTGGAYCMGSAAFSFPKPRAAYAALPRATAAAADSVAGGVFRRGARRWGSPRRKIPEAAVHVSAILEPEGDSERWLGFTALTDCVAPDLSPAC